MNSEKLNSHTYVLGTGLSHDGSACLLKDGRIAVAIEKERITRRKHDGGHDDDAIRYCLQAEGLDIADVDLVVQNANFSMFERGNDWFRGPRLVGRHPNVVTISHHLAHAYSAVATAPFDECAVLVVDGCGNAYDECLDRTAARSLAPPHDPALDHLHFEKDSYYHFDGSRLRPLAKDYSPWGKRLREYPMCPSSTLHSIGGLYQAASMYCLGGIDDSGKLMGLAPYGRPGVHQDEIFSLQNGRVFVNEGWMPRFDHPRRNEGDFADHFQYYADIARWVQQEVERALLYLVRSRHALHRSTNLAYAGGVALNAVANRRILRETPFERLYVQPAAGDNGLAIGCAYYGWMAVLGQPRLKHDGSSAFGQSYSNAQIRAALDGRADRVDVEQVANVSEAAAQMLADGLVVGWFQGRSEFGPRALGHRSILADPRRPGLRDHINAHIKFREDFRPFAPSVTEEAAAACFDIDVASPYMLLVVPVHEAQAARIPDVVHADGSCRPQTVSAALEPQLHALLTAFARRSGLPVVLNTSLNRRGMPIVETPEQAIDFFLTCALDVLFIGDFIVRKRPAADRPPTALESALERFAQALREHRHELTGASGICELRIQDGQRWTLDLSPGQPALAPGGHSRPDVTIHMDEEAVIRLVDERGGCAQALLDAGRLAVRGREMVFAMLLWMLQQR